MKTDHDLGVEAFADIQLIRSNICNTFLISLTVISIPALIASLSRVPLIGWKPLIILEMLLFSLILLASFFRHKLQYHHKASLIILCAFLVGLGGVLQFGLISAGICALVILGPITTLFFDGKKAGIILVLTLFLLGIIGYSYSTNVIGLNFNLLDYAASPAPWALEIFMITLCGGSLAVAMHAFNKKMIITLHKSGQYQADLKKTIEQVQISKQQLNNVIDGAQLGYWDWNCITGKLIVNNRWLSMLGLSTRDIENNINDWSNRVHLDDIQQINETVAAHIKSGESYTAEFRMQRKNGDWLWIQGAGAVVEYDETTGQATRLCGTHQDITERKKLDIELHEYRNSLENLVTKRTKELEGARNEAEEANLAKSQFLSSMSHELRTPLNAVIGFSQLLLHDTEEILSDDQAESVRHIELGGEHLLDLINSILDLSKIESQHIDLTIELIDIKLLFEEICTMVKLQAEQNAITLCNKINAEPALFIQSDRNKLKQVLLNFSSNAIKYNSKDGVVTFSCNTTSSNKIRLSVSDTGKGVSEENFSLLFEPFNRLDKANSSIQGTGIGLTISKQLVKTIGGEIGVQQNFDKGLTFWVELPLAT